MLLLWVGARILRERKKIIAAGAATITFLFVGLAMFLRSGFGYQFINEAPFIRFAVQIFYVLQVKSETQHLLTPAACVYILFADALFRLLFCLLSHFY